MFHRSTANSKPGSLYERNGRPDSAARFRPSVDCAMDSDLKEGELYVSR
jgi:hypothetical protein